MEKTYCRIQLAALSVAMLVLPGTGCHLRPNFGPPGTIYEQRSRAVLSDPFPRDDLGPPVVSGRPRGYETPLAQPANIQASPYSELNKNKRRPLQRLFGR